MSRDEPMDWETMEAIEPLAGEELERAFARYARVRLDPSPAQVRRARAAVMEAAWRSRIRAESGPRRLVPRPLRRRVTLPFSSWSLRRVSLAASAAVFAGLLVGSSVFAASRAGGPLYEARIAIEQIGLPSDPAARLQAQIANAQMRLAEAYDASARGDEGAMNAALREYGIDAAALANTTGPGAAQALAAIEQHRNVLLALIGNANADALPGLTQALASSDKAIERLSAGGTPGAGNGSGNPGNGGGNGNPGNGHPAATPGPTERPNATPKPAHTPKPAPTPKAQPAPTADPSPKPDHTPKAGPSSNHGSSTDGTPAAPSPSPSAS